MQNPPLPTNNDLAGVSVVILAAGYGSRLRPSTDSTPKAMLPIGPHPFLAYPVAFFLRSGVAEVIIAAGHLDGVIRGYFACEPWHKYPIKVYYDGPLAGTGRTLILGANLATSSTVLVTGGDLIVEFDIAAMAAKHAAGGLICTFAVSEKSPQNEGAFHVDSGDRLVFSDEISSAEKVRLIQEANLPPPVSATSSTGTALIKRSYLTEIEPTMGLSLEQNLLPALIRERQIQVFDIGSRYFYEFGVPERYEYIRDRHDILERIYGDPFM